MMKRRDVLKWSATVPAIAAWTHPAFASMPSGLDAIILDSRFAPDVPADQGGVPVLRMDGDVTRVWFETIDPAWRARGFVLGGITGSDALFVLEALAQQQGRRVVSRHMFDAPAIGGIAPVRWVIAPVHPSVLA